METSRGLAVKVGIFFVVGLILLVWFSLKSEGPGFGKKTYTFYAYFNKTNNLVEGDPVTLAGMQIGKVKSLTFDTNKQKIKATLIIYEDKYTLKKDSIANIALKSIMGQKYIDITFGSPSSPSLKDGETIVTAESQEFEEIISNVGDLTKEAQEMVASINKNQDRVMKQISQLIDDNKDNIKKTTQSFADASPKIERIATSVDKITGNLAEGKGTVGKLLVKDEVYNNVSSISGNLKTITKNVKDGKGTIGKMVNDDSLYKTAKTSFGSLSDAGKGINTVIAENKEGIKTIISGTKDSIPKIEKSVQNIKDISDKINTGQGTIGKLVNDPSLFNDTKKAINQVQEAFEENQEQSVLRTFVGVVLGTML